MIIACLGNTREFSFNSSSKWKLGKLKVMYLDVCGPINVETLRGNKYFVTFIDDATKKEWDY